MKRCRLGYVYNPCSLNGERDAASVADTMGTPPGWSRLCEAHINHSNSLSDGTDATSHSSVSPMLYTLWVPSPPQISTEEAQQN